MAKDLSIIRYTELAPSLNFRRQKMDFTLGVRSKTVSGILKLVQMVTKMLLTTPGTDLSFPKAGTPIQSLVQRGVTKSNAQTIKMDVMVAIQDVERQIQDFQAAAVIPDDERLQEIQIRNVEYAVESAEWMIEISVLSQAGTGVAFDIGPFLKGR